MGSDSTTASEQLKIVISDDRVQAWVCLPGAADLEYAPPRASDIRAALESAKIAVDATVLARVEQLAATLASAGAGDSADGPSEVPEKYLIAEGKPPMDAQDGTFEWHSDFAPSAPSEDGDTPVDYFALNSIVTVSAGVCIGRIKPPVDAVSGTSVFGNALPPQRRQGTAISVGEGLRLGEDGGEVITEVAGRVVFQQRELRVDEVLEINGDINFDSGSVEACVDVNVRGTVQSKFRVQTSKSLTIGGAIEAAVVEVDGDITVRGGICGRERTGRVRAGGTITARFCDEACVQAGGDIHVAKETLNSRVRTTAHLVSKSGTIIGGDVWAREGIQVGVLGSDAGVATRVATGISPEILQRAAKMEQDIRDRLKSAEQIRGKIQPLMANLKRLTAQQREMATELLSKADEMEMGAEDLQAEHDKMLEESRPQGTPTVRVHRMIHAGVRVALGRREARFTKPVHGPVKIEEQKVNNATELVCVSQRTGSVTVLPSVEVDLEALPADEWAPAGDDDGNDKPASENGTA